MQEKWKDIKGSEGEYQISNLGRVKSVERYTSNGRKVNERIIKNKIYKESGYEYASIQRNNKRIAIKIHREVAKAFIDNPYNYPEVNHKDENKLNNTVDNLEWCTRSYNAHYGTAIKRAAETRSKNHIKEIDQYSTNGEFIKRWRSAIDVERNFFKKVHASNIRTCCLGRMKTAYGYKWQYAE